MILRKVFLLYLLHVVFSAKIDSGMSETNTICIEVAHLTTGKISVSNVEQTAGATNRPFSLPVEALFYALPYMGLRDLLSIEQVCKASRIWVRDGVVLWHKLHVERPLSSSLTDEVLFRLLERSNGQLQCLSLVDCMRITERAVEHAVMMSPRLTKLFLPGCSKVTADGFVNMVKAHSDQWGPTMPGLKQLKIQNISGLTEIHLQSLLSIMGMPVVSPGVSRPRFYNADNKSYLQDYQRPIDVEVCPKCRNVRMVYDCTREECQIKQGCRACAFCTVRCAECGVCLQEDERNETACFDYLCLKCWLRLPKCSECNRPACGRHSSDSFDVHKLTLCGQCIYLSLMPSDVEYDL